MSRIGVLGGTFDPVHIGHLAIAQAALEAVPLDRVLFVPARRSPLKGRAPVASEQDRVAMLAAAVADAPRFEVSRIELERPAPSYTADTLAALAPLGELYLIVGADAAAELDRWKDPERVLDLATLLVAARPGAPGPPAGKRVVLLDAPRLDISSSELRDLAASGRSLRYLVPDAVWRYIDQRGLYREGAAPSPAS